jgi:hypothetical protein
VIDPIKPVTTPPTEPATPATRSSIAPLLEEARILRLEPGDVIVLRTPLRLSFEQIAELEEQVTDRFPSHKAIVLAGGMELTIARPEGTTP